MSTSVLEHRIPKERALIFVARFTPLYAEIFKELKENGGRVVLNSRFSRFRSAVGSYVLLYDDERKIGASTFKGLIGLEAFDELERELASSSIEEIRDFQAELIEEDNLEALSNALTVPETEEEWAAAEAAYKALPEDEQKKQLLQESLVFGGVFAGLFNTLSVMVHGAKLTALVPQAVAGDDDAYLKAIQIDRCLLTHHPYFISRKQRAQDSDTECEFLRQLTYRESNPTLRGKIRYPALYLLFGLLQSVQWLDDLPHNEILDICDEARLDRYQNRIEDVNYLTKRLLEYRRWQETKALSMH